MDALVKAVAALAAARTVEEVMGVVRNSARSLTGADGVTFVLRDGQSVFYADEDAIAPLWKGSRFPLEQCVSGLAMLKGEVLSIPDIYVDPRVPVDAYHPTFVRSLLMTPIGRDESIAAIGAYWATVHEATTRERQNVQALAEAASLAFRNISLDGRLQDALTRERDARLAAERASLEKDESYQSLRRTEARLRKFIDAAPVGFAISEPDGSILLANDALLDMVGCTREEFERGLLDWQKFTPAEYLPLDMAHMEELRRGGTPPPFEKEFLRRDGNRVSVLIVARFLPEEGERMVAYALDITESKRLARELEESNSRFDTLANASPVLLWVNGGSGNQYVNRAYVDFVGAREEELLGDGWQKFVHPDDLNGYFAAYLEVASRGDPFDGTFRLRRHDGEWRWMQSRGQPLLDPRGAVQGYAGSSQDVTELVAAQQALREADRHKDEFLATLAHELRNPLAPIRNAVHLLKLSSTTDPQVRAARGMIERQLHQMIRLVDDLMEVSRITLGQITLQSEQLDLRDVLSGALESALPLVEASGHQIEVTLPPEPVPVQGDLTRLSQVFQNLLNNASKYTPRGGEIGLRLETDGMEAVVVVRDNGVGVPHAMQSRIFELFTRSHPTDEIKASGLGIGLALSRQLTELHGGRIEMRSDGPGTGAEFRVRLPMYAPVRRAASAAATPALEAATAAGRNGRRILVVDDNRDAAESLSMFLQIAGYEVDTAFDGIEGLQRFESLVPDIVLLDIGMPQLDGYEVARRIRATPAGDDVLLVALTGWGQDKDRSLAQSAGFDEHMTKPVDPDVLTMLLAAHGRQRVRGGAGRPRDSA
ncbi:MAG TPA: PAS domain S-box protein [Steroidobacteraceae bacterium]|nr:PAS domain S-box protein [Steroidobacteraceae bacterium]